MKTPQTYTAAILADIHAGCMFAPWPSGFQDSRGGKYEVNEAMQYLNQCWQNGLDACPALDFLLLNGDVIDGKQPKQEGRYLVEPSPNWQAKAAWVLLQPWKKKLKPGGRVYATRGTEYHENDGETWTNWLMNELKARPDKWKRRAWPWLNLDIGGVKVDIYHRQSFFLRYKTTSLARELEFDVLASDLKGGKADLIIRSHIHNFMTVAEDLRQGLSTPGWEVQTDYCLSTVSPNRFMAQRLGFVLLEITPEKKKEGLLPVHIEPVTWPMPKVEIAYVKEKRT